MDYCCDVCIKAIKFKNNNNHLQSNTDNELNKSITIKHTIKTIDFFDINDVFNKYITNHKKMS